MLNDFTETNVVPIPTEVPDPTSTLTKVPFPSSVVAPTPNLETPVSYTHLTLPTSDLV